jgi:hypothetical protein
MAFASFIGIEVAWKVDGNHSGIAVLGRDKRRVLLKALCSLYALLAPVLTAYCVKSQVAQAAARS